MVPGCTCIYVPPVKSWTAVKRSLGIGNEKNATLTLEGAETPTGLATRTPLSLSANESVELNLLWNDCPTDSTQSRLLNRCLDGVPHALVHFRIYFFHIGFPE